MLNQLANEACCGTTRPTGRPGEPNVANLLMKSTCILGEIHGHVNDMLRVVSCAGTNDATTPSADCMLQEAVNLEEGLRGLHDKLIMLKQFLWEC